VPLEDVDSSNELGARIARELDVRLAGRQDPLDQVIEFLHERQMLLVLDNFEQLAADVSILERLLQACARLKIIVTSRVRLAVSMEWLLPVEGLPCPEIEDQDHFEAFDAVRLFVQAAQRVEPALVPAVEAASIVDICRQLEGLPLALELAAAWTRVLSCDAIAAELRQGTELLQAADAARPARHASIEIVFEQSWRSLSPVERDSLSRLSVFRGGFTAEAARAIAGARLPVLGALADKSLLRKEEARIFMHPLVQQLAELRLNASDHRESTERAHALYFHRSLAQLRRSIENGDREALRQVDSELENYRVAWTWSIAHEDGNTLVRSAPTLLQFFDHSGRFGEGVALLSDALDTPVASTNLKLSALLLGAVGQLQFRLDRYAEAMATATRAREAAKRARDPDSHALSLQVLGSCSLRLVKHEDARRFFKAGLEQALAAEDQRKANTMLHNSALVEKLSGNQDDALRIFLEALSRHRALGDFVGEALSLANLGLLYAEKGDLETASSYLRAGLDICDRHGFASTRVLILANLTGLAIKTNDLASAEKYGKIALDIAQATDNRHVISSVKVHFSRLALRRGDLERARSDLEASLRIANQIDRPALVLEGISCFAEILAAQGDKDCARMVLTFATNHPLSNAPERNEYLAKLAQWGNEPSQDSAWPGIELNELAQRIVIESNVAHAPLIATLRGAH
jgi:predicted ATPase